MKLDSDTNIYYSQKYKLEVLIAYGLTTLQVKEGAIV